jgi:hypothetical protein
MAFAKGSSGNYAGRPIGATGLRKAAREKVIISVETLARLAADTNVPAEVQATAAIAILSFATGEPLGGLSSSVPNP